LRLPCSWVFLARERWTFLLKVLLIINGWRSRFTGRAHGNYASASMASAMVVRSGRLVMRVT
jgi:hypothetical protein